MEIKELKSAVEKVLNERAPGSFAGDAVEYRDELTIYIKRAKIQKVCEVLRDYPDFDFDLLVDITAIDWLPHNMKPRFEVVYNIYSIQKKHRVRIKCAVSEEDAVIDSVVPVWQTANFLERETFDLFGIIFKGHPDLTRILMPDEWNGHPLRKDYPLGGIKSFYFKRDTDHLHGEPEGLVPRIRTHEGDI